MDCACAVSHDYESEDTYWGVREINRAAKDHKCYECGGVIPKGSPYFIHIIFGNGTANNYKYCKDCQSMVWQFFSNGWWFGQVWENLAEYLADNWRDDLPSSCICQLTPGARGKVCDMIQKIHNEMEVE